MVLYFYPRDNTSGCAAEAKEFTELLPEFEKHGAIVIGVSKDSLESHKKFRKKHGLRVILLSDPETKIIRTYEAWGRKMRDEGHAARVLETLEEIQQGF